MTGGTSAFLQMVSGHSFDGISPSSEGLSWLTPLPCSVFLTAFLSPPTFSPCFSLAKRFWHDAHPSRLSAAFLSRSGQEGLKHDLELEQVPKVRIVFEKRDKICSDGVFRMKYLLVFDISTVESCLLSFRTGQSWRLLSQKCPSGWLGLPMQPWILRNLKWLQSICCASLWLQMLYIVFLRVDPILHQLIFFLVPSATIPTATKIK